MKLTDTILLLRNGYTKDEIKAMTDENETETMASLKADNEKLRAELEKAQKVNINAAEMPIVEEKEKTLNDYLN